MIDIELELAKCRERTKDEAVILLMMQAKVDVLSELVVHTDIRHKRDELALWVTRTKLDGSKSIAKSKRPKVA